MRLAEGGSNKRSETARQLGYLKDPEAVPILERRWDLEPDPTVRYWVAKALGWIGGSQSVQILHRLRQEEKNEFALSGIDEALSHSVKRRVIPETNSQAAGSFDEPLAAHNE
jgi:HEAT repeat protein